MIPKTKLLIIMGIFVPRTGSVCISYIMRIGVIDIDTETSYKNIVCSFQFVNIIRTHHFCANIQGFGVCVP